MCRLATRETFIDEMNYFLVAEERNEMRAWMEMNSVSRGSEAAQANKKQKLIKSLLINSLCLCAESFAESFAFTR